MASVLFAASLHLLLLSSNLSFFPRQDVGAQAQAQAHAAAPVAERPPRASTAPLASTPMGREEVAALRARAKAMFEHAYDSYMERAFPHDELKPISGTWTDSLVELGNAHKPSKDSYSGCAMTLIDALDTLAVMGNKTEFEKQVNWVVDNVHFDFDARVHLFEANIRLLGGLLSAHVLASDQTLKLMEGGYSGGLLDLAYELAKRLLRAFEFRESRKFPYAWVNLKRGVQPNEVHDTCTAGVGTLILEFGLVSYLTGDMRFFEVADEAMDRLWKLRSKLDLLGNTLDGRSGKWTNSLSGIGAGIDSFYEYLFKAYIVFGNSKYLKMFDTTYKAVERHLRSDNWYVEADMHSGKATYFHFNSLQAFWPGLQVLYGDIERAAATHDQFFGVWQRFNGLPERYIITAHQAHSTENYYPQRPEIVESTWYLYRATKNPKYLHMGKLLMESIESTRVQYGYAQIKDVRSGQLSDRMSSYFLAETCKYLYLLFDEDNFVHRAAENRGGADSQFVFTTEGHVVPVTPHLRRMFSPTRNPDAAPGEGQKGGSAEVKDVASALGPLEGSCIRRSEGWWTYELCHNEHLRQFHLDTPSREVTAEHMLGVYERPGQRKFLKHKRGGMATHVSIALKPGSPCGEGQSPRKATVEFHCDEGAEIPVFASISETMTCAYVAVVRTRHACRRPDDQQASTPATQHPHGLHARKTEPEYVEAGTCANLRSQRASELPWFILGDQGDESDEGEDGGGEGVFEEGQCFGQQAMQVGPLHIEMGTGQFVLSHDNGEVVTIRNLGQDFVEVIDQWTPNTPKGSAKLGLAHGRVLAQRTLDQAGRVLSHELRVFAGGISDDAAPQEVLPTSLASFSKGLVEGIVLASGQWAEQRQTFLRAPLVSALGKGFGCEPATQEHKKAYKAKVVLVERGVCSFVSKAREAFLAGAVGVVVGNTHPPAFSPGEPASEEAMETVFVMDGDGSEGDAMIPTVMVTRAAANTLKAALRRCSGLLCSFKANHNSNDDQDVWVEFVREVHTGPSVPSAFVGLPPAPPATPATLALQQDGEDGEDGEDGGEAASRTEKAVAPPPRLLIGELNGKALSAGATYLRGTLQQFQYTTMGQWQVLVQNNGGLFMLSLVDVDAET